MSKLLVLILFFLMPVPVFAQQKPVPAPVSVCKSGSSVEDIAGVLAYRVQDAITRRGLSWRQYAAIRSCILQLEMSKKPEQKRQAKMLAAQLEVAYTHYGWESTEKILVKVYYYAREIAKYECAIH
jgi:hypothetical protein